LDDYKENRKEEGCRAEKSGEEKDEIEEGDHLQEDQVSAPENFMAPAAGANGADLGNH